MRRNRVWQFDFSEFETGGGGTWQWAVPLTIGRNPPWVSGGDHQDSFGHLALDEAVGRAEDILGRCLELDCVNPDSCEIEPLNIVTDNGSAMRSVAVARWFVARPWLRHIRTRVRAPHTNGVIERFFEALKYERSIATTSATAPT